MTAHVTATHSTNHNKNMDVNVIQCPSILFITKCHSMFPGWKYGGNLKKTISGLCQCRCCTILVIFICHELPPPVLAAERSHDRAIVSSYRHIADICWPCLTILIRLYTYDYIRYTALHNSRSSYSYLIIFYIYNIHFKHVSPYDMRPFHAEVVGTPTTSPTSKSPWSSPSAQWTSAASCRSSATKRDLDAQTPLRVWLVKPSILFERDPKTLNKTKPSFNNQSKMKTTNRSWPKQAIKFNWNIFCLKHTPKPLQTQIACPQHDYSILQHLQPDSCWESMILIPQLTRKCDIQPHLPKEGVIIAHCMTSRRHSYHFLSFLKKSFFLSFLLLTSQADALNLGPQVKRMCVSVSDLFCRLSLKGASILCICISVITSTYTIYKYRSCVDLWLLAGKAAVTFFGCSEACRAVVGNHRKPLEELMRNRQRSTKILKVSVYTSYLPSKFQQISFTRPHMEVSENGVYPRFIVLFHGD